MTNESFNSDFYHDKLINHQNILVGHSEGQSASNELSSEREVSGRRCEGQ